MKYFLLFGMGVLGSLASLTAGPSGVILESLPEIRFLSPVKDSVFKQQQELLALYYQSAAQRMDLPDLTLFRYRVKADDTLFTLGARLNLSYETLSTLNGLQSAGDLEPGRLILIPSQPGLFLSLDHPGSVDKVMASWRTDQGIRIKVPRAQGLENVLFLPGLRFHAVERAFFMGILFRFPLPQGHLTSNFGLRSNPFTGHPSFHNGIDIGAPTGTDIYAVHDGTVTEAGWSDILGNYVKIDHGDGYETVYGHMSRILVSLNQALESGTIIGKVGTTGQSTGPHLHFEIRRKGHPLDPVPMLPAGKL